MAEPILTVEGLAAGYGDVRVLWDINLAVAAGEITCIVGSNGAGKTTLLRTISGLVPASSGRIAFQGEDIDDARRRPDPRPRHRPRAGGAAAVPRPERARQPAARRLSAQGRAPRCSAISTMCSRCSRSCASGSKQDATTLSGGEQQMCAIGRGIMSRPKLLMIDELSLGLAPRLVERLSEALLEINRNGLTILLVEQDVMTAFEIARHALIIETGRVSMTGTTAALADNPAIRQAYLGM